MAKVLFLSHDELAALLAAAQASGSADYTLLLTIYLLALRASEAVGLKMSDYDGGSARIMVGVLKRFHRKRQKDGSFVPAELPPPLRVRCEVPAELCEALDSHVASRRSAGAGRSDPIFAWGDGSMTRWTVLGAYHRAARAPSKPVARVRHPHVLRHTRAMHQIENMRRRALDEGKAVTPLEMMKQLKELLRHASDSTCLQYIHATEESAELSRKATSDLASGVVARVNALRKAGR